MRGGAEQQEVISMGTSDAPHYHQGLDISNNKKAVPIGTAIEFAEVATNPVRSAEYF